MSDYIVYKQEYCEACLGFGEVAHPNRGKEIKIPCPDKIRGCTVLHYKFIPEDAVIKCNQCKDGYIYTKEDLKTALLEIVDEIGNV